MESATAIHSSSPTLKSDIAGVLVVALSNLIPVVGLLAWQWGAYEVALLIWLDGAVKLIFLALKTAARNEKNFAGTKAALILLVFYGGFMFGHFIALGVLLSKATLSAGFAALFVSLSASPYWQACTAGLIAVNLYAFLTIYLPARKLRVELNYSAALEVRARVWLIQIAVLIIALMVVEQQQSGITGLVGLILVKTVSDSYFEWRNARLIRKNIHDHTVADQNIVNAASG